MRKLSFKLVGISGYLFHKFNIGSIANKTKSKSGSAGNNPDEWKETVHSQGTKLYIPKDYFFATIMGGAKYVKQGKGSIASKVAGCLHIKTDKAYFNRELPKPIDELENEELSIDSSDTVYLDIRGVKNPATKGKNVRYRLGLSPGWEAHCELEFDDSIISKEQMREAIICAGKFSGIGDGRSIGFGRYDVYDIKFS